MSENLPTALSGVTAGAIAAEVIKALQEIVRDYSKAGHDLRYVVETVGREAGRYCARTHSSGRMTGAETEDVCCYRDERCRHTLGVGLPDLDDLRVPQTPTTGVGAIFVAMPDLPEPPRLAEGTKDIEPFILANGDTLALSPEGEIHYRETEGWKVTVRVLRPSDLKSAHAWLGKVVAMMEGE